MTVPAELIRQHPIAFAVIVVVLSWFALWLLFKAVEEAERG